MHNRRGADRRAPNPVHNLSQIGLSEDRRRGGDRRERGFISRLQLFFTIPYDAIEAVIIESPPRFVTAGEVLLEPGQANNAIHMLVSGRLRIHLDRSDSPDFIPIDEGGCFGELSIIDGRPASAYVVADQDSRILTVPGDIFWERLAQHPAIARNLLRMLSERMRINSEIILDRLKDRHALELLRKELSIAHDIQMSMLPSGSRLLPEDSGARAVAMMEPAKNVGGDFYDAFAIAPGRLFFAIGDVSGKGIPAALFMARTLTQLRMEAVRRPSPAEMLEAANNALCAGNDAGMFVTLFCGILDTASGEFTYANAGHNPPLLIDGARGAAWLEVPKGLVLGFAEGVRYQQKTLRFREGQSLLMYTDGVTEAMDAEGLCYGEARLLELAGSAAWQDPQQLVDAVRQDIASFVQLAPQADDITMLVLHPRMATPRGITRP